MKIGEDDVLCWGISGVIGVGVRDLYSMLAKVIGLAKFQIWVIGADLFIEPSQIHTIAATILGFLVDFVVGSMMGAIIGLLIKLLSPKHYILIGIGVSLLAWLFFFGILYHTLPQTQTTAPKDALSNISGFIGHSIFGIVTAFTYVKLAKLDSKSWQRS